MNNMNTLVRLAVSLSFLLIVHAVHASGPPIFLEFKDERLRSELKIHFYDRQHKPLSHKIARRLIVETLSQDQQGNVCGVYSGFCRQRKGSQFINPMNAEQTIPQSWFKRKAPMLSDLHHLFPTHKGLNSARSHLPFADIPDDQVDFWYGVRNNRMVRLMMPPADMGVDAFSELKQNQYFEPPEAHKGNIARAVAYFYTMYPGQADDLQRILKGGKKLLRHWHALDPIDNPEKVRNKMIETYQGNLNPYILDSSLLCRAWGFRDCEQTEIGLPPSCDISEAVFSNYDVVQSRDRYPHTQDIDTHHFYLVYSWSPGYCDSRRRRNGTFSNDVAFQCESNNEFGWVVHGLWGQAENARSVSDHPRYCQGDLAKLSEEVLKPYLCMSPGKRLLQGEWEKHGACDFETANDYFSKVAELHNALVFPDHEMQFHELFTWMQMHNEILKGRQLKRLGKELVICYDTSFNVIDCY